VCKSTSHADLRAQYDGKSTNHQLPAASSGAAGSATTEGLQRITALLLEPCCLTRLVTNTTLGMKYFEFVLVRNLNTHGSASRWSHQTTRLCYTYVKYCCKRSQRRPRSCTTIYDRLGGDRSASRFSATCRLPELGQLRKLSDLRQATPQIIHSS
jgi:hypothetical protein